MQAEQQSPVTFRRHLLVRIGILIWICLGSLLSYHQGSSYLAARQSEFWPSVTGKLAIHQGLFGKDLSYTYVVDGTPYTSDRVAFGELGNRSSSHAFKSISQLADGSEVKVYHRPSHPEDSTVSTQLHEGSKFQLWLGIAIFFSGGLAFLLHPLLKRKASPTESK